MNETLGFNAYISYLLIAVYYVIMLRLWLPPPPSDGRETGDDKATVGPNEKSSRAVLRQVTSPLANDNREPGQPAEALPQAKALERIRAADEHFDESTFLSGASKAYELVVNAYAKGDTATLNGLLGPEAVVAFGDAISERREKGESITLDFVGIRKLDITDAWLEADPAEITVRFVSELVTVRRAADNRVIDGDPNKIVTVTDLWTFARRVPARNPNWKIVATEGV
jgi:predicted lipid-binding transport protein (Tim44 family)